MRSVVALLLALSLCVTAVAADKATSIGREIENFSLQDFHGEWHALADYEASQLVVVAFLGTECPLAKLYAARLQELADEYADRGVTFIGVDSNRQDSITEIAHYARVHEVDFPLLKDVGNEVADQFGAERTPQVFVLDGDRTVRYMGRVDDQYGIGSSTGYARTDIRRRHLAEALDELLAGERVSQPVTDAPGCIIGRVREADLTSEITYSNQIARILQQHCVECHREGQIAPFALTDYEEVAGWGEMMAEVVREQRMPPWHADPRYGVFSNDRSMTQEEKDLLYAWVASGAPEGDPSQLPEPIEYPEGWQAGEPEQVFYMDDESYTVPADGVVEYQYFYVDPGWTEDRWVKSTECWIGNRRVVHHIFVFAVPPDVPIEPWDGAQERGEAVANSFGVTQLIGGAAPGTPPMDYPIEGMAAYLPAGTKLLFQMHYTPIGHEVEDLSGIGFRYCDGEEVRHTVHTNLAINVGFRIPAGHAEYPVKSERSFREDALLLTFAPHMHLRGKSFRYDLHYPDGTVETLLNVPQYDFNWQMVYALAEPKFVPAGSTVRCHATFDNSADNLANPDPTMDVTWGDQTWEEMMIGWMTESTDIDYSQLDPADWRTTRFLAAYEEKPPRVGSLLKRAAARCVGDAEETTKFLERFKRVVPQVDRVCIGVVEDDTFKFLSVAQAPVFLPRLGDEAVTYPAASSTLAEYAGGSETVVNNDLQSTAGDDMLRMSSAMASSLHVPIEIDGRPALASFWSSEPDAFPEPAVEIIQEVAAGIGSR